MVGLATGPLAQLQKEFCLAIALENRFSTNVQRRSMKQFVTG
jgi:hypothetical protein